MYSFKVALGVDLDFFGQITFFVQISFTFANCSNNTTIMGIFNFQNRNIAKVH